MPLVFPKHLTTAECCEQRKRLQGSLWKQQRGISDVAETTHPCRAKRTKRGTCRGSEVRLVAMFGAPGGGFFLQILASPGEQGVECPCHLTLRVVYDIR